MHYILNLFWQVEQPQIQGTRERVHLVIHQEVLQEALARPSTYSSHVFTNPEFSICNCLFDTIGILYSILILKTDQSIWQISWKKFWCRRFKIRQNMR